MPVGIAEVGSTIRVAEDFGCGVSLACNCVWACDGCLFVECGAGEQLDFAVARVGSCLRRVVSFAFLGRRNLLEPQIDRKRVRCAWDLSILGGQ